MAPVERFIAALGEMQIDYAHHFANTTNTGRRGKARFETNDCYHLIISTPSFTERLSLNYSTTRGDGVAFGELTVLADYDATTRNWTRVVSRERWELSREQTTHLQQVVNRHFAAHLLASKCA